MHLFIYLSFIYWWNAFKSQHFNVHKSVAFVHSQGHAIVIIIYLQNIFIFPKGSPVLSRQKALALPSLPPPLATTHLLSLSIDLPSLDS